MGRQPSDLNEERTMLKAGLFLAFVVLAAVQVSGDQKPSNAAMQRYMAYGRPNSMIFLHPTRSMEKRGRQIFLPRPNSLLNAVKGKRFLHSSPNSFNFPIWSRPVMEIAVKHQKHNPAYLCFFRGQILGDSYNLYTNT